MSRLFRHRRGTAAIASGLAIVAIALMLASCGKKGSPGPPPDQPNAYPRPYPSE